MSSLPWPSREPSLTARRRSVVARFCELASAARASRRELGIAGFVLAWIAAGATLDAHASLWQQRGLGVITWTALLLILRGERRAVRAQVAIVIAVATTVEYLASDWLGVYTYRLHNVPLFVPPGHGLLYLTALALGRSQLFAVLRRPVIGATIAVGGTWAVWGAFFAPRSDVFGALCFLCLLRFLLVGRAPLVYAGAFIVCSYLELVGTSIGTWAWAPHDLTGLVGVGNPPSGIPGAYCFFDAAALAGCARLLWLTDTLWTRVACRHAAADSRPVLEPGNAGGRHGSVADRTLRSAPAALGTADPVRGRPAGGYLAAAPAGAAES